MQRDSSIEPLPSPSANVLRAEALSVLPAHRDLYYGGAWHRPLSGNFFELTSPGTGQSLGHAADASAADVAPFGGVKQSGLGREECLEELLSFTQEKNIHMRFAHVAPC